jgi:hypothetical protein
MVLCYLHPDKPPQEPVQPEADTIFVALFKKKRILNYEFSIRY